MKRIEKGEYKPARGDVVRIYPKGIQTSGVRLNISYLPVTNQPSPKNSFARPVLPDRKPGACRKRLAIELRRPGRPCNKKGRGRWNC